MNQDLNALQPQNGIPGGWSPGGGPAAPGSVDSVSVAELLMILRRRRLVMLQTFVIITVVAIVVTLMTKPVYQATARLLLDNPTMSYNAVDTATRSSWPPSASATTPRPGPSSSSAPPSCSSHSPTA